MGNNQYFSFAVEGLIEEYETGYLNLKIRERAGKSSRYQAKAPDARFYGQQ